MGVFLRLLFFTKFYNYYIRIKTFLRVAIPNNGGFSGRRGGACFCLSISVALLQSHQLGYFYPPQFGIISVLLLVDLTCFAMIYNKQKNNRIKKSKQASKQTNMRIILWRRRRTGEEDEIELNICTCAQSKAGAYLTTRYCPPLQHRRLRIRRKILYALAELPSHVYSLKLYS